MLFSLYGLKVIAELSIIPIAMFEQWSEILSKFVYSYSV